MKRKILILFAIIIIGTITKNVDAQSLQFIKSYYSVSQCNYCNLMKGKFKEADLNNDGTIDVSEIRTFQAWLTKNYDYKQNLKSIPPDDFILQNGGDCEDFAAMTCCLLNYYGIVAYVATFGKVTVNKHAVCMVKVNLSSYPGMLIYSLQGYGVPNGYYMPIDYNKIGGLSAIDRRWKIASMSKPNNMFYTVQ